MHYFRDLYRTLDKNHADEFKALFDEMHGILKDAIGLAAEHPEWPAPKEKIQKLQDRIDAIAHGSHTDKDCKRYAERLRREGRYLLTFLERDVAYHNNPSERAPRIFACMRKTLYGNRSEAGMETTETLATIYHVRAARHKPVPLLQGLP